MIILSVTSFFSVKRLAQANKWNSHTYEVLGKLDSILISLINMETGQRGYAITGKEEFLEPFKLGKTNIVTHFSDVKKLTSDNPRQQELLTDMNTNILTWISIAEKAIANRKEVNEGKRKLSEIIEAEEKAIGKSSMDNIRKILDKSKTIEYKLLKIRERESGRLLSITIGVIVIGSFIAICISIIISLFLSNKITNSIHQLLNLMEVASQGDFTVKAEIKSNDEILTLGDTFNSMISDMSSLIEEVANASSQILISSKQVSESSNTLAQGSSEQASSVDEITATLKQIEEQAKNNAISAESASNQASIVKEQALAGNKEMGALIVAMKEISETSENIAKIIKEIDAIAFQTNILALNAAVEAARAGQHGKGFNVVAEEVRNLASRSAVAAKETARLIEGSIKKVNTGTEMADRTAEVLNKMTSGVIQVTDLIKKIADASLEQSRSVAESTSGVNQISQVAMNAAATAEESSAASVELASQAESFRNMIQRFKINKSRTHHKRGIDLG
ncbi:MAG: CHASE3 domain-containing protein [Leptospiraceae bacterium]|nr:CHASE3 domain-containing protein [Leptospiraceae bacterium]MCP5499016.1 CHASE3 domain-containing protein [Leptospiraceae bacterium]